MAIELKAEPREVFGKKVKTLRNAGFVPAEIYGHGVGNISIQAPEKILKSVLGEAGATNLISIKIGRKKPINTLARNIQYSPIKHTLLHVDFYAVDMANTVQVSVPIRLIGEEPELVKQGGMLITGITELDLEALPSDLPESIEVDISELTSFGDAIHVSHLNLPDKITVHSSPESLIVTIQPPRVSEEEEEVVETVIEETTEEIAEE